VNPPPSSLLNFGPSMAAVPTVPAWPLPSNCVRIQNLELYRSNFRTIWWSSAPTGVTCLGLCNRLAIYNSYRRMNIKIEGSEND
jgi:hypothetical protein